MEKWDVVIVGAGPGGAYAAKTAAEKGLKTVFFERGRKPGEKNSSGAGLGTRWWRDFPEVMGKLPGLPSYRKIDMIIIKIVDEDSRLRMVQGSSGSDVDGKRWTGSLDEGMTGASIYRCDLDPLLADMAVRAGAELRTGTLVTDVIRENGRVAGVKTESGESVHGEVVIAADGAMSTMAKASGMRNRWGGGCTLVPQLDFECDEQKLDDVVGNSEWCWFGPFYGAYQVNFRSSFHLGAGQWLRPDGLTHPVDRLKRVTRIPAFQSLVRAVDARPREYQAHLLPWLPEPPKTYSDGIMLVGDAAGFPCPFEGEGIWHACISGRIAAETAARALSKGDTSSRTLSDYERRWKASPLGLEHQFGKEFVDIWDHSIFNPELMKKLIQLLLEYSMIHPFSILFDWSDAHLESLNDHIMHLLDLAPEFSDYGSRYILPLTKSIHPEVIERVLLMIKPRLPALKHLPDSAFLKLAGRFTGRRQA